MADDEDEKQPPIYDDEEQDRGIFRWMSTLVVLLAIAGFFGLAWYAYKNGGEVVDEKDVELVKADKTPIKEAPANPGECRFPIRIKPYTASSVARNQSRWSSAYCPPRKSHCLALAKPRPG